MIIYNKTMEYYCPIREARLTKEDALGCIDYDPHSGLCNSSPNWDACQDILEEGLEKSLECPEQGDWITSDSVRQSLRNLRMMDGE